MGKIRAKVIRFWQNWSDLSKIKILHPQKYLISYGYESLNIPLFLLKIAGMKFEFSNLEIRFHKRQVSFLLCERSFTKLSEDKRILFLEPTVKAKMLANWKALSSFILDMFKFFGNQGELEKPKPPKIFVDARVSF